MPVLPPPVALESLPGTPFTVSIPAPPSIILWSVPLVAAPSAPPVIADDRVFLSSLPGLVTSYDIRDGREVWRESIAAEWPLAVSGGLVFVAAGEAVHALRTADRTVAWRTPTGSLTAPLLAQDGWVIASSASQIMAIRAADGGVIWSVANAHQRERPAIFGDLLFVPLATGLLRALDLRTGAPRWERQFAGAPAEPLVLGDRLYFGASDKNFYCVDADDGEEQWQIARVRVRGVPSTDGVRVFFVGLDNLVRAVSRDTGSQHWQQGVSFRPFSGPTVTASTVFVAGPTPDVRLLNPLTGRDRGTISFPERLAIAPAIGTWNDRIVLAGVSGGLTETWQLWFASPILPPATK